MRNLVYFSPVAHHPVGGIKVFYRHAEAINGLGTNDWRAQVFHWEQPDFACNWFAHQTALKTDGTFEAVSDVPILPECHLWNFWRQFSDNGVRYGIFVQNGFLIGANRGLGLDEVAQAYRQASLILVISDEAAECVRLFVPECAHKIVPVRYAIPSTLFHLPDGEKENLITFMPRKLAEHAQLVSMFLQPALPAGWRIAPIDGLPEAEVAATLRRSKIFMSFCSLEGLPMPPAEAALCGNQVVGYTGQGAREYWAPGLFTEVPMGDIRGQVAAVLRLVDRLDARQRLGLPHLDDEARIALETTRARFSVGREAATLKALLARADEALAPR